MQRFYFLLFLALTTANLLSQKTVNVFNFSEWVHPDSIVLPSPCELLPLKDAATILKISEDNISQKFTQGLGDKFSLSCFYKWEEATTSNAGMLLQVMKNGYPEEKNYISKSFSSKFSQGEFIQHLNKKVLYKKYKVGKVEVAYNPVTFASYWHIGDNYMFHMIFNLNSLNEDRFLNIIDQIVPETNKNMIGFLLK